MNSKTRLSALGIAFCGLTMLLVAASPLGARQAVEQPTPAAYRLAPGDAIELRMFFNPELNDTVQIRPDGRISLQLLGEVAVGGLTIAESSAMIERAYASEVRTPKVTIQVRAFAGQKVFVTGEVVRPGAVIMPGEMTLLQAIGEAGGAKTSADGKSVVVIRKGDNGAAEGRKLSPYVSAGKQGPDGDFKLLPFDIVVIPESRITRLDRWVDQHLRGLNPLNLSAGFTYVLQRGGSGGGADNGLLVPIF